MHTKECAATKERANLIKRLRRALGESPQIEGTEEELGQLRSELEGILAEYENGGDQMDEACTCGEVGR